MTDFYRFPAMAKLGDYTNEEQIDCICKKCMDSVHAYEAWEAESDVPISVQRVCSSKVAERRRAYGMELMDVIHSAETALRMEFAPEEASALRDAVEAKNRKRGYYDD